ncbi:alanine racemase [Hymenobacter coccineus]|uniref:alanine racemase n=1 Tax=Hymenobacter coccineus TaxID=1908235 RepID=UPI001EFA72A2|nr:alanine racemase [Hymenobacter coccineus]
MLESGLTGPALYARVGALLPAHGVTRLVGIGPEISAEMSELKVKSEELKAGETAEEPTLLTFNSQLLTEFYPSTEAFLAQLNPADFAHETILVKGARRFGFERIVAALQAQQHGTVLEVNLDALGHNLQHFRQQLRPGTKLMVMVKAFAYGAGSYEVASLLEFQRADYLAVAYADEGIALREAGIGLPIMVMNPAPDAFELLRRHRLEPEIYSFEILEAYLATLPATDAPTPSFTNSPIHIKLDTGMRRLGFEEADVPALGALLRQHRARLPVAGIMTHLAAADDPAHDDFTRQQLAAFGRMARALEEALGRPVLKHALNSAGIRRFPEAHFDMVRLGIGLYGVDASGLDANALRPVSTLRTTISQIKTLPAGATVGYGRRGTATDAARRIATLAIGYADGYDRRFSSGAGVVLVHGQRAPVVGSVAMDMCMVDVTDIPAARAGDVAVVFGAELPLPLLAARIGTIAYELLTNVSERVKRVFVTE